MVAKGSLRLGRQYVGRTTFISFCLVSVGGYLEGLGHWEHVFVRDRLEPSEVVEAAVMIRGNLTSTEYILSKPFPH